MISILMVSIRESNAKQRILDWSNTNLDYEIVVVSPFKVTGKNVVHILEKKSRGIIYADYRAYKHAKGDWICFVPDDQVPIKDCLEQAVNFAKGKTEPFIAGFRRYKNYLTRIEYNPGSAYGRLCAGSGVASRSSIEKMGGFFNPIYKSYFADTDMCIRAWVNGGSVDLCPTAFVDHTNILDETTKRNLRVDFPKDAEIFMDMWHDKLGAGIPRDINKVDHETRLWL